LYFRQLQNDISFEVPDVAPEGKHIFAPDCNQQLKLIISRLHHSTEISLKQYIPIHLRMVGFILNKYKKNLWRKIANYFN